jgi:hypothetical protein
MIRLSKAFNPGDLDPGATYQWAKVVSCTIDESSQSAMVEVVFGNMVADQWVPGTVSPKRSVLLRGADRAAIGDLVTPLLRGLEGVILQRGDLTGASEEEA